MRTSEHRDLQDLIQTVARHPDIAAVRLLRSDGLVLASSMLSDAGTHAITCSSTTPGATSWIGGRRPHAGVVHAVRASGADDARPVDVARRTDDVDERDDRAAHRDPWMHYMRRGDFARAWEISDQILAARRSTPCWHLPRHEQYIWDGTPFDNRHVLVRCYHGLGDTIQFARYLPLVRARAARVTLWVQASLIPLVATIDPAIDILPLHDGDPGVSYDVEMEIMELPHAFRTTLESVPDGVPYVHVQREGLPATDGLRVGLVWRAGDWAEHRSIPFDLLRPLADLPVTWYVLQGWPGLAERPAGFGIVAGENDLHELARVTRSLDLVITVDSLAAHLAGALAVPVWTLLHTACDWRWMIDRDDSPWYPTMRLFRQPRDGDWANVVASVRSALTDTASAHCTRA